ncbi:MAG: hypothetical protein ABUK01_13075 [Leptospirales bacterium]
MNKKILAFFQVLAVTTALLWTPVLSAKTGIGVMGGDPNGITLKFNNFPVIELGYDLGWGGGSSGSFDLNVDYWIINKPLGGKNFFWFLGIGASVQYGAGSNSWFGVGARVPIGLQWFPVPKVEIFAEVAPGLAILPGLGLDVDFGVGVRFYIF